MVSGGAELAAPEELQRYNDYAGKIRYLLQRFDGSHDPKRQRGQDSILA
jgi:hypothetical protein